MTATSTSPSPPPSKPVEIRVRVSPEFLAEVHKAKGLASLSSYVTFCIRQQMRADEKLKRRLEELGAQDVLIRHSEPGGEEGEEVPRG